MTRRWATAAKRHGRSTVAIYWGSAQAHHWDRHGSPRLPSQYQSRLYLSYHNVDTAVSKEDDTGPNHVEPRAARVRYQIVSADEGHEQRVEQQGTSLKEMYSEDISTLLSQRFVSYLEWDAIDDQTPKNSAKRVEKWAHRTNCGKKPVVVDERFAKCLEESCYKTGRHDQEHVEHPEFEVSRRLVDFLESEPTLWIIIPERTTICLDEHQGQA